MFEFLDTIKSWLFFTNENLKIPLYQPDRWCHAASMGFQCLILRDRRQKNRCWAQRVQQATHSFAFVLRCFFLFILSAGNLLFGNVEGVYLLLFVSISSKFQIAMQFISSRNQRLIRDNRMAQISVGTLRLSGRRFRIFIFPFIKKAEDGFRRLLTPL